MSKLTYFYPLIRVTALTVCALIGPTVMAESNSTPKVTIIVGTEGPEGCELLGKVKGSSRDGQAGEDDLPYVDRLVKARNNLRAETQKLGGDSVHITYSNNSGKYEVPGTDKEIFFAGHAYRCQ